jgi:hypothetical protein
MMTPESGALDRNLALSTLLRWEGEIRRSRVIELFRVSPTRASEWIREFREVHSRWVEWNPKERCFEATPIAYGDESERGRGHSLTQYLGVTGDIGKIDGVSVRAFRDFISPDPRIYSALRRACSRKQQVEIAYRSMRDPQSHLHLIEPHALVLAGPRWHVRAYSASRGEYLDFALGRILACKPTGLSATHEAENDKPWTTNVNVKLMAHPQLSPAQEDVVRHEYFGGAVERIEVTRGALVPYLLQELRVALDTDLQHPPDYLLAVRNNKDVEPWMFPA